MLCSRKRIQKGYQYCSDISGTVVYLRALQGHSGRSLIDPSLQDSVIIQCGLFHHIYHIGCAFNLHSIINNGLIPGGQDSSTRQTVFFLPIGPRDEDHEDPEYIDFSVPQCMEETSRRGILGRYWSWNQERISVLSNSIECSYPLRNTSSLLYSNSSEIEDWRSFV